jgi:AraC-like DNA-binding protein
VLPPRAPRFTNERADALLRVIRQAWRDPAAERVWAERIHLSRFHFQRVFAEILGETPGQMRRRLQLEGAAHQLATAPCPVTDVAFDTGFESVEGFCRAFKRAYGATPSEFRARPLGRIQLPAASDVHFDPDLNAPRRFTRQEDSHMDLTDRLIDHDVWLTRQLLVAAQGLPEAVLDQPLGQPMQLLFFDPLDDTLRQLLRQLIFTREIWLAAVRQQPLPTESDDSLEGLLQRLDDAYLEFAEFVRQVRDENRWDEEFVDALCDPPETFTYGGIIAHVLTFTQVRRTLALHAVRAHGITTLGDGDPIMWESANRAAR